MLVTGVHAFVGSTAFVFPGRGPGKCGGAACAFWGSACWGCLPWVLAGTPAGVLPAPCPSLCSSVGSSAGARLAGQQDPCLLIPDSWWVQMA